jgi:hypothetical protein
MTATSPPEPLFSERDLRQMAELGIPPEEAARQVEIFRHPPAPTYLLRACQLGDGIRALSEGEKPRLRELAQKAALAGRASRFVPASGAATRMFKDLLAFLNEGKDGPEVATFFDNLPRFAFAEALASAMARAEGAGLRWIPRTGDWLREAPEGAGPQEPAEPVSAKEPRREVLSFLLTAAGLGYADLPKGLLLFHRYPAGPRTPFEEHLVEAARTQRREDGLCRLHFTVSPQHEAGFRELLEKAGPRLGAALGAHFEACFSRQEPATDTLAVDLENRPFRQADGSLLFRPGGHGALLGNLAAWGRAGGDLVLLKNIDNVLPDAGKPLVNEWKQLLLGLLVDLTDRAHALADRLEREGAEPALLDEGERFLAEELSLASPPAPLDERARRLADRLDRPFRVAGMVSNTGETGGGPFWVRSAPGSTGGEAGEVSLQIVETAQVDRSSPEQEARLAAATHFNPVDLVCSLRDRHGRPHDLERYVDPGTAFLAEKSYEGRALKALEHPGLWNGAMAGWNTVFVEVPAATFAPVKTVLDLLRPEHQGPGSV